VKAPSRHCRVSQIRESLHLPLCQLRLSRVSFGCGPAARTSDKAKRIMLALQSIQPCVRKVQSADFHHASRLNGLKTPSARTSRSRVVVVRAIDDKPSGSADADLGTELKKMKAMEDAKKRVRKADSTDPIATALTRRFGMAGGVAWLGVLTFGVVSEQLKTRRETFVAERDTKEVTNAKEVTTASGLKYVDKVVGGGEMVGPGLLVGVSYTLSVDGTVVLDASRRPQIILYGGKKAPSGGLCAGVFEALADMRAGLDSLSMDPF